MGILTGLAGLLIGVVTAWQLTQWRADAGLARLRAQLEERICYWQDEAERARATASRVSEQKAAWVAGCQQGRDDVLSLARALAGHGARADHETPATAPESSVSEAFH